MVKSLGGHIPNTSPGFIDRISSRCQRSGDGQLQPRDSMALYLGAVLSPSVGLRWPCCSRASEKKCTGKAWHTVGLQCVCDSLPILWGPPSHFSSCPTPFYKIDFWFVEQDLSRKSSCWSRHDKPVTGLAHGNLQSCGNHIGNRWQPPLASTENRL